MRIDHRLGRFANDVQILESFMRKIGSSYETASNGLIAVEKYKKSSRRFDFILMGTGTPFARLGECFQLILFQISPCQSWMELQHLLEFGTMSR